MTSSILSCNEVLHAFVIVNRSLDDLYCCLGNFASMSQALLLCMQYAGNPVGMQQLSQFMALIDLAGDGVTIKVGVHYESRSPRRIALRFEEAGVSDVHITSLAETLIAPALLPRGWLQQRILLALKEVSIAFAHFCHERLTRTRPQIVPA